MKLFITGADGQVGTELHRQAKGLHWQVMAVDRDRLNITDAVAVRTAIAGFAPDVVVNAAAYTTVDKAESEPEVAFAVNRDGPANLSLACEGAGIPLVHYSTDYIFDGSKGSGYLEDDPVSPLGVYGASKLAGEVVVRDTCSRHLILRTSWVFSAQGHNFVKCMLKLGGDREELGVVADQRGKPTAAAEIARLTLEILTQRADKWGTW